MTQNEITDREMLELAAKAAGYETIQLSDYSGFQILDAGDSRWWNPLENNGDNFQLAVKLGLFLEKNVQLDLLWVTRRKLKDPDKFIRRSIVFCAAKIERSKNG
jgi:hypothetical protein